jgi:hypothetical protein
MQLFKRKTQEHTFANVNLRSFRFLGEEAEALGQRLDAARRVLAEAKTEWVRNHWSKTVEQLVFQWRQLPILHDADARMTVVPRWTVDYEYYELGHTGEGHGATDRAYHKLFRESVNLDVSWENHRAARLARAQ